MYKLLCSNLTNSHRSLTNFTGYYRKVTQKYKNGVTQNKRYVSETDLQNKQKKEDSIEPVECLEEELESDVLPEKKSESHTSFFSRQFAKSPSLLCLDNTAATTVIPCRLYHSNKKRDILKKTFKNKEAEEYYQKALEQCVNIKKKMDKFYQQAALTMRPPRLISDLKKEFDNFESNVKGEEAKEVISRVIPLPKQEKKKPADPLQLEKIKMIKINKPHYQFKENKIRITYPTHSLRYKLGTYNLEHNITQQVLSNDKPRRVHKDPLVEPLQSVSFKHEKSSGKDKAKLNQDRAKTHRKKIPLLQNIALKKHFADNTEKVKQRLRLNQPVIKQHPTVRAANASTKMSFKTHYNKLLQKSDLIYNSAQKDGDEATEDVQDGSPRKTVEEPESVAKRRLKSTMKLKAEIFHKKPDPKKVEDPKVIQHPIASAKQEKIDSPLKSTTTILTEKPEGFDIDTTCIKDNIKSSNNVNCGDYAVESDEKVKSFVEIHKQGLKGVENKADVPQGDVKAYNEESTSNREKSAADTIGEYIKKLKELRDQTALDGLNFKKSESVKKIDSNRKVEGRKIQDVVRKFEERINMFPARNQTQKTTGSTKKNYPISSKFIENKRMDSSAQKAGNVAKDKAIKREKLVEETVKSRSTANLRQVKGQGKKRIVLKNIKSENLYKKTKSRSHTPIANKKHQKPTPKKSNDADAAEEQKKTLDTLKKIMEQYKVPVKPDATASMAEMKRINRRKRREQEKKLKEELKMQQKKFDEEELKAMEEEVNIVTEDLQRKQMNVVQPSTALIIREKDDRLSQENFHVMKAELTRDEVSKDKPQTINGNQNNRGETALQLKKKQLLKDSSDVSNTLLESKSKQQSEKSSDLLIQPSKKGTSEGNNLKAIDKNVSEQILLKTKNILEQTAKENSGEHVTRGGAEKDINKRATNNTRLEKNDRKSEVYLKQEPKDSFKSVAITKREFPNNSLIKPPEKVANLQIKSSVNLETVTSSIDKQTGEKEIKPCQVNLISADNQEAQSSKTSALHEPSGKSSKKNQANLLANAKNLEYDETLELEKNTREIVEADNQHTDKETKYRHEKVDLKADKESKTFQNKTTSEKKRLTAAELLAQYMNTDNKEKAPQNEVKSSHSENNLQTGEKLLHINERRDEKTKKAKTGNKKVNTTSDYQKSLMAKNLYLEKSISESDKTSKPKIPSHGDTKEKSAANKKHADKKNSKNLRNLLANENTPVTIDRAAGKIKKENKPMCKEVALNRAKTYVNKNTAHNKTIENTANPNLEIKKSLSESNLHLKEKEPLMKTKSSLEKKEIKQHDEDKIRKAKKLSPGKNLFEEKNNTSKEKQLTNKPTKYQLNNLTKLKEAGTRIVRMVEEIYNIKPKTKLGDKGKESTAPENRPTIRQEKPKPNPKDKSKKERPKSKTDIVLPPKSQTDPKIQTKRIRRACLEDPRRDIIKEINEELKRLAIGKHESAPEKPKKIKSLTDLVSEQKAAMLKEIEAKWNEENNKPNLAKVKLSLEEEKDELERELGRVSLNINKRKYAKEYGQKIQESQKSKTGVEAHNDQVKNTKDEGRPRLIIKLKYRGSSINRHPTNKDVRISKSESILSSKQTEANNMVPRDLILVTPKQNTTPQVTINTDQEDDIVVSLEYKKSGTDETKETEKHYSSPYSSPLCFSKAKPSRIEDDSLKTYIKIPNVGFTPRDVLWQSQRDLDMCFAKLKRPRIEDDYLKNEPETYRGKQQIEQLQIGDAVQVMTLSVVQQDLSKKDDGKDHTDRKSGTKNRYALPLSPNITPSVSDVARGTKEDAFLYFGRVKRGRIEGSIAGTKTKPKRQRSKKKINSQCSTDTIDEIILLTSDVNTSDNIPQSVLKVRDKLGKHTKKRNPSQASKSSVSSIKKKHIRSSSKIDLKNKNTQPRASNDRKRMNRTVGVDHDSERSNNSISKTKDIKKLVQSMKKADEKLDQVLENYKVTKNPEKKSLDRNSKNSSTKSRLQSKLSITKNQNLVPKKTKAPNKLYKNERDSKTFVVTENVDDTNGDKKLLSTKTNKKPTLVVRPSTPQGRRSIESRKKHIRRDSKLNEKNTTNRAKENSITSDSRKQTGSKGSKEKAKEEIQLEKTKNSKYLLSNVKQNETNKSATSHKSALKTENKTKTTKKEKTPKNKDPPSPKNETQAKSDDNIAESKEITNKFSDEMCIYKNELLQNDFDYVSPETSDTKLFSQLLASDTKQTPGNKIVVTSKQESRASEPENCEEMKEEKAVEVPGKRKASVTLSISTDIPHSSTTRRAKKLRFSDSEVTITNKLQMNNTKEANRITSSNLGDRGDEDRQLNLKNIRSRMKRQSENIFIAGRSRLAQIKEETEVTTPSDHRNSQAKNSKMRKHEPATVKLNSRAIYSISRSTLIDMFISPNKRKMPKKDQKILHTIFVNKKMTKPNSGASSESINAKLSKRRSNLRKSEESNVHRASSTSVTMNSQSKESLSKQNEHSLGKDISVGSMYPIDEIPSENDSLNASHSNSEDIILQTVRKNISDTKNELGRQLEILKTNTVPELLPTENDCKRKREEESNVIDPQEIRYGGDKAMIPNKNKNIVKLLETKLTNEVGKIIMQEKAQSLENVEDIKKFKNENIKYTSENKLRTKTNKNKVLKEIPMRQQREDVYKFKNHYLSTAYNRIKHVLSITKDDLNLDERNVLNSKKLETFKSDSRTSQNEIKVLNLKELKDEIKAKREKVIMKNKKHKSESKTSTAGSENRNTLQEIVKSREESKNKNKESRSISQNIKSATEKKSDSGLCNDSQKLEEKLTNHVSSKENVAKNKNDKKASEKFSSRDIKESVSYQRSCDGDLVTHSFSNIELGKNQNLLTFQSLANVKENIASSNSTNNSTKFQSIDKQDLDFYRKKFNSEKSGTEKEIYTQQQFVNQWNSNTEKQDKEKKLKKNNECPGTCNTSFKWRFNNSQAKSEEALVLFRSSDKILKDEGIKSMTDPFLAIKLPNIYTNKARHEEKNKYKHRGGKTRHLFKNRIENNEMKTLRQCRKRMRDALDDRRTRNSSFLNKKQKIETQINDEHIQMEATNLVNQITCVSTAALQKYGESKIENPERSGVDNIDKKKSDANSGNGALKNTHELLQISPEEMMTHEILQKVFTAYFSNSDYFKKNQLPVSHRKDRGDNSSKLLQKDTNQHCNLPMCVEESKISKHLPEEIYTMQNEDVLNSMLQNLQNKEQCDQLPKTNISQYNNGAVVLHTSAQSQSKLDNKEQRDEFAESSQDKNKIRITQQDENEHPKPTLDNQQRENKNTISIYKQNGETKDATRPIDLQKIVENLPTYFNISQKVLQDLKLDKFSYDQFQNGRMGSARARIEEILTYDLKEQDKIMRFNKNLVRYFKHCYTEVSNQFKKSSHKNQLDSPILEAKVPQKSLQNFLTMELSKPYHERNTGFSLLQKYNKCKSITHYSKDQDNKSLVVQPEKADETEEPRKAPIHIEKTPTNRYHVEKKETPPKPVPRSCERLCLPTQNISQVALKPPLEEMTTSTNVYKAKIQVPPKKEYNALDKYKNLKITHIKIKRRPRRKPDEAFLPAIIVMKRNGPDMGNEQKLTRREVLERRYELLRKLHKEFSNTDEKDKNMHAGKFEKVLKRYKALTENTRKGDEVVVKQATKSMDELLGPSPTPSFDRVSRYYNFIVGKEKAESSQDKKISGQKSVGKELSDTEILIQKLPKKLGVQEQSKNDTKVMPHMTEKTVKKDDEDDPESKEK